MSFFPCDQSFSSDLIPLILTYRVPIILNVESFTGLFYGLSDYLISLPCKLVNAVTRSDHGIMIQLHSNQNLLNVHYPDLILFLTSLGSSNGKESAFNARDLGLIPRFGKIPWKKEWQPTPVFLLGEFHGQKSLSGYSPWGQKRVGHD